MYAQEMAATSQPLSGGQQIAGGEFGSFDEATTGPTDDFSALEQQLHAQLGVLTQRVSSMHGAGAGPALASGPGLAAERDPVDGRADSSAGVRFEPAPRSPVIHEGWVVPARLDQLITSDIGGQVRALVTEDVYDSVTGRFLLIPAGTRAVGQYGNGVVFGQNRLAVVWTRLIFPDGSSLHIDAPGTDGSGSVGLRDRVNNYWGQVLGAALLSTVFSVGVAMANDDEGSVLDRRSNSDVARSTAANEVARVGSAVTGRALTIPPTIEVRPGYALQIRVNRDWYLQPWRKAS
jgi:type IV secretion system protein VirB10